MEIIIFIGLQGAGKSSFYRDYFLNTHIRINLDMLKTRNREKILIQACFDAKQRFVVDNTNPTLEDRARYIIQAKQHKFRIIGYYFQSKLEDCKQRNQQRHPQQIIPIMGLISTQKKLVIPSFSEGFDALYYVRIAPNNSFVVKEWEKTT